MAEKKNQIDDVVSTIIPMVVPNKNHPMLYLYQKSQKFHKNLRDNDYLSSVCKKIMKKSYAISSLLPILPNKDTYPLGYTVVLTKSLQEMDMTSEANESKKDRDDRFWTMFNSHLLHCNVAKIEKG